MTAGYNDGVSARIRATTIVACALAVTAALSACGSTPATPTPDPMLTIRPIHVDSVDVSLEGAPAAHVHGVIGDGCTALSSTQTTRSGPEITITIYAQRPTDAICTQIARIYDETLRLPGPYPPGDYVVRVNGVERAFTIP